MVVANSDPGPDEHDAHVAVVSPHFDDAVLSCTEVVRRATVAHVVTVFSGGPLPVRRLTDWDRMTGAFCAGDDVIGIRMSEEDAALSLLGATGHRLGFWDFQYRRQLRVLRWWRRRRLPRGGGRLARAVASRLEPLVDSLGARTWFVPVGLVHPDHVVTAEACRIVAHRHPELGWVAYEDLPYAQEHPELVEAGLAELAAAGWVLGDRPSVTPDAEAKRAALRCYGSQIAALGARAELAVTSHERYHGLVPAGRGTAR